jgi:hypothetical protein
MTNSKGAAMEEINRADMDNKAVATEKTNRVDMDSSREVDTDNSKEGDTDNSREGATDNSREVDTDTSRVVDMDNSKVDMDRAVAGEVKEGMAMTTTAPPEVVVVVTGLRIALTKDMEVEGISTKKAEDQAIALEATLTPSKLQTTPSNMAVETATCFRPPCRSWAARDSTISQTQMSNSSWARTKHSMEVDQAVTRLIPLTHLGRAQQCKH